MSGARPTNHIKSEQTIIALGPLADQPTAPPKHIVLKAKKSPKPNGGSAKRQEQEWVYKTCELNPAYRDFINKAVGYDATKRWNKAEMRFQLYIDIVISEYMNFMGVDLKARIVTNETGSILKGKLSTYIPGLKTFAQLVDSAERQAYLKEKQREANQVVAVEEIDFQGNFFRKRLETIQNAYRIPISDISKIIKESADKYTTLCSFAEACVVIQRLEISDLHANNIGKDQNGRIQLFDVEHAIASYQGTYAESYSGFFASEPRIEKAPITQQPNLSYLKTIIREDAGQPSSLIEQFKQQLGDEDFEVFQRAVYRRLLREIICPDDFIEALLANQTIPKFKETSVGIATFLIETKEKLQQQLMSDCGFIQYLHKHGDEDMAILIPLFELAQKKNKQYFQGDDYLARTFIIQIHLAYTMLMNKLHDNSIRETIKPFFMFALPSAEVDELLKNLQKFYADSNHHAVSCRGRRDTLLRSAANAFLQIVKHPEFSIKHKHCRKLIRAIEANPKFLYKVILAAFYANNIEALKILLPVYLKNNNVNAIDQYDRTLLHYAAINDNSEIFNWLMTQGARIDQYSGRGLPVWLEIIFSLPETSLHCIKQYPLQFSRLLEIRYHGKKLADWGELYGLICKEVHAVHENFFANQLGNNASEQTKNARACKYVPLYRKTPCLGLPKPQEYVDFYAANGNNKNQTAASEIGVLIRRFSQSKK